MKINFNLLPMKLHYFFMFAGTAPLLPYLPVYANTKLNMSYSAIGLVYTILPFLGLLAKIISGTLADWLWAHQKIFIISIIVCATGFFSIYFVPPMPLKTDFHLVDIHFDCSSPSSYLRHSFPKISCGTSDAIAHLKADQTATCQVECNVNAQELASMYHFWNVTGPVNITELVFVASSKLSLLVEDGVDIFFPVANISLFDTEILYPTCDHPMRVNCRTNCDNGDLMSFWGAPKFEQYHFLVDIISKYSFWSFCFCISMAWCGLAVLVVISDTKCFQLLGSNVGKFGQQRLFGSLGWGSFVIITGLLIDISSDDYLQKNYMPAFVLSICVFGIDLLIGTRLKVEASEKNQTRISDVTKLICQPQIVLFIICCTVVGISTGVLWTYQLMLVERVAFTWDCHFRYMKLLQGLIIGVSSFGGELPFFFISGFFIKKLGHINAMSVVIAVFGLRFILYFFVKNPWAFLPIELLNGFTFGIFYSVMTSYASIVAPPGTQATMQGLVGASFEGLGVAMGGFIGGALFESVGGPSTFLFVGIFSAVFALFHVIIQIIANKFCHIADFGPQGEGYLPPSESLRQVTSEDDDFHLNTL